MTKSNFGMGLSILNLGNATATSMLLYMAPKDLSIHCCTKLKQRNENLAKEELRLFLLFCQVK